VLIVILSLHYCYVEVNDTTNVYYYRVFLVLEIPNTDSTCTSSSECLDDNAICNSGTCECDPRFTLNTETNECDLCKCSRVCL